MTSESLVVLPARPACCHVDITVPGYPDIITESSVPISIPNSSAFVDTTPLRVLALNAFSMALRSVGRYPALYVVIVSTRLGDFSVSSSLAHWLYWIHTNL